MSEAALVLPPGPWTVDDLAGLPDDGLRYEIVDGALLVSPAPALRHQGVVGRLAAVLAATSPLGWETVQGPGLALRREPTTRLLIPDIAVVRCAALWSGAVNAGPDDVRLAVEVVSPSSVVSDRVTKPTLYAEAAVPAYWRVELDAPAGITVFTHRLAGERYVAETSVRASEDTVVEWPFRCRIAPAELIGSSSPR